MNAVMDEIGQLVEEQTLPTERAHEFKVMAGSLLPCESASKELTLARNLDEKLAAQYPVIDLDAILSTLHTKKFAGIPAPRFALYSAFKPGSCSFLVSIRRQQVAEVSIYNSHSTEAANRLKAAVHDATIGRANHYANVVAITTTIAICALVAISAIVSWSAVPLAFLPLAFLGFFAGVGTYLYLANERYIQLTATFAGYIPSAIRQKIKHAKEHFDEVLLVQEVTEWNAEVTTIGDPLVVGKKNGVAYLIDRFDTTTLEEYVAKEFTT